jgi:hypothetical protein
MITFFIGLVVGLLIGGAVMSEIWAGWIERHYILKDEHYEGDVD